MLDRCAALRRTSARSQADLRAVVDRLRRGEGPPAPRGRRRPRHSAVTNSTCSHTSWAVPRGRASPPSCRHPGCPAASGSEQKVEVFVNLARRLQSLVHREIQLLDELENEVEDPDLLKGLFHVDHLATRIRRHAENLAVLGGAISRRQWTSPVTMTEVLRSAIAEVEQYPRVKLVPPIDGTLRGHAVADVIHLLAELVENATLFSAPHTQVLLRAQHVTAGLAVEVEDRGLGMPLEEQDRMNALLADPDQVNVGTAARRTAGSVCSWSRRSPAGTASRSGSSPTSTAGCRPCSSCRRAARRRAGGLQQSEETASVSTAAAAPEGGGRRRRAQPTVTQATSPPAIPRQPQPQHVAPRHQQPQAPQPQQSAANRLRRGTTAAQPQHQPQHRSRPAAPGAAPLPVRAAHPDRPNPAEAPPGFSARGTRPGPSRRRDGLRAGHQATPAWCAAPWGGRHCPGGAARSTSCRSSRTPPPPRKEDEHALHDPGLMAAFQRGIGLAEAHAPRGLRPAARRTAAPRQHPQGVDAPWRAMCRTGHVSDLDWLLSGLVQRVPYTRSAVLLSSDGLVKSVHGLDHDSADHMAALASGLYSLGRSAGTRFGDGGEVRQVVVELDSTLLFVSTAGSGTCLAVLAGREADAAVLGYEMAMLVKSVRPYLATPARQAAGATGVAGP